MSERVTRDVHDERERILGRVAARSLDELDVDHAAIAVATSSTTWVPAYTTSPTAARIEEYAFTVGEGPCFDALREHTPILVHDLSDPPVRTRWPAWSVAAREAGVRSVASFPIQSGAVVAGALTLYAEAPGHLAPDRVALALRLADAAFLGLLDMMAGLDGHSRTDGDRWPLVNVEVHQAAGMVMAQMGVSIDQALARLRAHAFASDRALIDVAVDVLSRRVRFHGNGTEHNDGQRKAGSDD